LSDTNLLFENESLIQKAVSERTTRLLNDVNCLKIATSLFVSGEHAKKKEEEEEEEGQPNYNTFSRAFKNTNYLQPQDRVNSQVCEVILFLSQDFGAQSSASDVVQILTELL